MPLSIGQLHEILDAMLSEGIDEDTPIILLAEDASVEADQVWTTTDRRRVYIQDDGPGIATFDPATPEQQTWSVSLHRIEWDTTQDDGTTIGAGYLGLPTWSEVRVYADDEEDALIAGEDAITERFGYCIKGYRKYAVFPIKYEKEED